MWHYYQIFFIIILIITAQIGDFLLEQLTTPLQRAFADNFTHALIGFFAWCIVSLNIKYNHNLYLLMDSILCLIIASFIDLDHFFAARSIYLKDATSLSQRPFLHLSTIPLSITIVLLVWAHFANNVFVEKLGLIIFVAFGTHHTRDAYRRGYWFAPFGSTPALSHRVYLGITILIPYFVVVLWKYLKILRQSTVVIMTEVSDDMELLLEV